MRVKVPDAKPKVFDILTTPSGSTLQHSRCEDMLAAMADNSMDVLVTDPPYGYSFMGRDWDKAVIGVPVWKEALRVLKPGAFGFIMSAPRQDVMAHMICNLAAAGFETAFTPIFWTYASGFPKAMDISLMVDKRACEKLLADALGRKPTKEEVKAAWAGFREVVTCKETKSGGMAALNGSNQEMGYRPNGYNEEGNIITTTTPRTEAAKALIGSYGGFQPKPAVEVVLVVMKPLDRKTYIDQALHNGKGVTWLDDGIIPYDGTEDPRTHNGGTWKTGKMAANVYGEYEGKPLGVSPKGRFPANLLCCDDVLNDGEVTMSGQNNTRRTDGMFVEHHLGGKDTPQVSHADSGSYSRYFDLDRWWSERVKGLPIAQTFPFIIEPKASQQEKNFGCNGLEDKLMARSGGAQQREREGKEEYLQEGHIGLNRIRISKVKNNHPTVKPVKLMSYLITIGSREGDTVMELFAGSGTTCVAAELLNRRFKAAEMGKNNYDIGCARVRPFMQQLNLFMDAAASGRGEG